MSDERLDRMGAFDAVMWGMEHDPILRSPIVAMTVLDAVPDVDLLIDRITRMTLVTPKLRQRVIGNPISPIPPRWETDPNFDLSFHLKRYHVPADGTDRPLLRIAEQMGEADFDRDRPLWEMALVQGWDGDRSAVIIKLHHAITDGVGGMAMAASLFDLTRAAGHGPRSHAGRADVGGPRAPRPSRQRGPFPELRGVRARSRAGRRRDEPGRACCQRPGRDRGVWRRVRPVDGPPAGTGQRTAEPADARSLPHGAHGRDPGAVQAVQGRIKGRGRHPQRHLHGCRGRWRGRLPRGAQRPLRVRAREHADQHAREQR